MKLLFILLCLSCTSIYAQSFSGHVVNCTDGDTCNVKHSDGNLDKIRLLGIDAPEVAHNSKEISQPYGEKCRDVLNFLIDDKEVFIETNRRDPWGRLLGRILHDDVDINLLILKTGCAWAFYPNGIAKELRASYLATFEEAKLNKIGLFAQKSAITPTIWRKKKHLKRKQEENL